MRRRLSVGHDGTHNDVAQQQRMIVGIYLCAVGTTRYPPGPRGFVDDHGVDGKRQNVGRADLPHVHSVHLGNRRFIDENHAEFGRATHALGPEHRCSQSTPSIDVDDDIRLLVGAKNLRISLTTNST